MRRALIALSLLALAACAPPVPLPAGISAADVALFRGAVERAGCTVATDAQAGKVEQATGFAPDKLRSLTEHLARRGELVQAAPGGFRLSTGSCAAA
ncbi:ATP synthase subunit E [Oceanicola granulosus HTCC2516]|uniref:ATP synthase subunit E n=1 Tax=Oceanicola granulosus (strain ATCC BAA-861 / DSM 15982 / KCTC 12143 / HTCC2516) TaxID=314256 RepID=Q2CIY8_OCEGH|nr:hypothetical protein [Oceanicola granulosus]EAR52812.1 ATP synthase subunit E [Oceanicola granulosus HTCC2516]